MKKVWISLLLVMVFALSTCAFAEPSGKLVIWEHTAQFEEAGKAVIAAFQEKYPNVEVDFQVKTSDQYYNLLATAFQAEEAPDLFWTNGTATTNMPAYAEQGLLMDLTDKLDHSIFSDTTMKIATVDGNLSFSFTVFSKFFRSFPIPLLEAARIDGASELDIFLKVVLPVTRPVIFTVALLNFVMIWNDFYMPLVFLTKSSLKTLTLGIYTYTADFLSNWNKVFAGVTIALLPIIVIYFFFSDRITAGMTSGSIKG